MDALNRDCHCVAVAPEAMHEALAAAVGAHGLSSTFTDSHPNLFAALPVYVSRDHLTKLDRVVAAVQAAVALPDYQAAVLTWAPEIARFDPGTLGGMLGLDFHITPEGPRLIEINTNPGGALLNALVGQALRSCMPEVVTTPTDMAKAEQQILEVMRQEWTSQMGDRPLHSIAIVDEVPEAQYLYPEFLLFRELFIRHGIDVTICDPAELEYRRGRMRVHGKAVDMIYNRLTDFPLAASAHEAIRASYLAGEVVVTPHPRAHAIYADKRNLVLLGNREFLSRAGAASEVIDVLTSAVPATILMTSENRDELWRRRRELFFKPAAGFGSKAGYRGEKLTRRVWEEIGANAYIAQELVPPSERHTGDGNGPLKTDVRCYAYHGKSLLYAARLYQGQTTNFRTPGGGFAPVLTSVT
ncbi:hypothetical protein [Dyella choica]|nr:hypothetical protein [Dyella choica]